jgi:thioredoxin reductase
LFTAMQPERDLFDVLIVGGGPAGLSAATWLGRARRQVILVDSRTPRNAAASKVHGFLTRDGVGPMMIRRLSLRQLVRYAVETVEDAVVSVEARMSASGFPTEFAASLASGRTVECRKVLFATGTFDDLPELPGFRECFGSTIHPCPYCDGWEHRDGRLIAYSESPDKAADLGLTLLGWSSQVTVVTNGRLLEQEDRHRLALARVAFAEERIVRLRHRGRRLRLVEFERGEPLEAAALFFSASQRQQCDLPERMGCVRQRAFVDANDKQRASVPGVYLAGDADGDVQFAIVAAAEGAKAAVTINKELLSEDRERPEAAPLP